MLFSCGSENTDEKPKSNSTPPSETNRILPSSNGGRLDLIVVANEALWQSDAGDAVRKIFTAPQAGLPQAEPVFNVVHIVPSKFNSLLKRSRNIIVLEKNDEEQFRIQSNAWAKPQRVALISGATNQAIQKLFEANYAEIYQELMLLEFQVLQKRFKKIGVLKNPKVLTDHNIKMTIPKNFELDQEGDNLLVYWNKTVKTDQGIIIHIEPMNEDDLAVGGNIIPLRDSITKLYIHGQKEGSYMKTEMYIPPVISNTELAGQFAVQARGLWRTEKEFKGGPFINYTIYDEKNKQIIFLDAFVYSPETKKRNFLLELESILRTIKIN